jgi:acyl-CoA reductase-like NAD-dependent aldehyde dehydrogenase
MHASVRAAVATRRAAALKRRSDELARIRSTEQDLACGKHRGEAGGAQDRCRASVRVESGNGDDAQHGRADGRGGVNSGERIRTASRTRT